MRHEVKTTRPTLQALRDRLTALGEKVGTAFEDEHMVYASSVALNGHGIYADSRTVLQWSNGWLTESRPAPRGHNHRAMLRAEHNLPTLPGRETDEKDAARRALDTAKADFHAFAEGTVPA